MPNLLKFKSDFFCCHEPCFLLQVLHLLNWLSDHGKTPYAVITSYRVHLILKLRGCRLWLEIIKINKTNSKKLVSRYWLQSKHAVAHC